MTDTQKAFWEYLNYAMVVVGLLLVYLGHRAYQNRLRRRYEQILA